MKKRLFCLALSMVMLSSSMIVSASELATESEAVNETVQEEPGSAQDMVLPADDSDVKPEATALPEESPSSEPEQSVSVPEEISTNITGENPTDEPEEIPEAVEDEPDTVSVETPTEEDGVLGDIADDGSQESELQTDDELLGAVVVIAGADQRENAVKIDLDTDYASNKQGTWYQFTTKDQPAWYRLETSNLSTRWANFYIHLWDGAKEINSIGASGDGGTQTKRLKLEKNYTYYIQSDDWNSDFYYYFGVKAFDDPEGESKEDAYTLPLGEAYQTSIAVDEDVDFYKIHTGRAGHYRIAVTNDTGGSKFFELRDKLGKRLDGQGWIGEGYTSDICLTLEEADTDYFIEVTGRTGNYAILAEYLTDEEGDTKETAYNLAENVSYSTDLCARDDIDVYRLTPSVTSKYIISISNHSSSGYKRFKLSGDRDTELKSGTVSGERTQKLEIDLTKGTVYYLTINNGDGKYTLSYKLKFPFTDVPLNSDNWKFKAVDYVNEAGVMTGVSDTLFSPDTALTRAQFASILYRMAGEPYVSHKNVFHDVPSGQWYSKAVIWAYDKKIVAGYSNGFFGIKDPITREQVARMLYLYSEWKGKDVSARANLSGFPDGGQVSGWAKSQVEWAVGMNMLSGKTVNGRLQLVPKGQATRAECASMISRYLEANK